MVGQSAQPHGQVTGRRGLGRSGIALPATIAALAAVSVLITGVWVIVDLNAKTSINRKSAMHALQVAEAGASHALGLMREELRNVKWDRLLAGSDNLAGTADDSLLIDYGLPSDMQIPESGRAFGGGRYYVRLEDDPADGDGLPFLDSNNKILARCRGVMPDGASAEILAVIGYFQYPALATEGSLKFRGNATIKGHCGGLHANEIVEVGGVDTRVDGPVTASDTVIAGDCQIKTTDGACNTPLHHQPPVDIPELTAAEMCTNPDRFVLRADGIIEQWVAGAKLQEVNATTSKQFGWTHDIVGGNVQWDRSGAGQTDGTFCVEGNAYVSGGGTDSDPWDVSIFSTGSVQIEGNPKVVSHDPSGALVVAEGDVKFSGSASTAQVNYGGLIYAGAQCTGTGTPRIHGQLLCKDNPNPAGSDNLVDFGESELTADVGGSIEITFGCGGLLSKRRVESWVQSLGS